MSSFILSQQPEILFSAICGPGATVQSKNLPVYLYVVYTYPTYMYTGFPECVPKANSKSVADQLQGRTIPRTFKDYISGIYLLRDDEFLKSIWRGSMWPVTCLYSPVAEAFTEAGSFLQQQRDKFITKEAVKGWLQTTIDPGDEEESAVDASSAWSYAEMMMNKKFSMVVPPQEADVILRRLEDPVFKTQEQKRLDKMFTSTKGTLSPKMSKDDLNEMLIAVRGLS